MPRVSGSVQTTNPAPMENAENTPAEYVRMVHCSTALRPTDSATRPKMKVVSDGDEEKRVQDEIVEIEEPTRLTQAQDDVVFPSGLRRFIQAARCGRFRPAVHGCL